MGAAPRVTQHIRGRLLGLERSTTYQWYLIKHSIGSLRRALLSAAPQGWGDAISAILTLARLLAGNGNPVRAGQWEQR